MYTLDIGLLNIGLIDIGIHSSIQGEKEISVGDSMDLFPL